MTDQVCADRPAVFYGLDLKILTPWLSFTCYIQESFETMSSNFKAEYRVLPKHAKPPDKTLMHCK